MLARLLATGDCGYPSNNLGIINTHAEYSDPWGDFSLSNRDEVNLRGPPITVGWGGGLPNLKSQE